jgi:hypothetical protein
MHHATNHFVSDRLASSLILANHRHLMRTENGGCRCDDCILEGKDRQCRTALSGSWVTGDSSLSLYYELLTE